LPRQAAQILTRRAALFLQRQAAQFLLRWAAQISGGANFVPPDGSNLRRQAAQISPAGRLKFARRRKFYMGCSSISILSLS